MKDISTSTSASAPILIIIQILQQLLPLKQIPLLLPLLTVFVFVPLQLLVYYHHGESNQCCGAAKSSWQKRNSFGAIRAAQGSC